MAFLPKGYAFILEENGKRKEVVKLKGQSYSLNYSKLRFKDLKESVAEYVRENGSQPFQLDLVH